MAPRKMMTNGNAPVGGKSISGGTGPAEQRPPQQPKVPKKQAEKLRLQALAQAEALFKGKRARPEYQKDLRKLEEKHGTKQFAVYAKKFLEEYGLPEEWGALTRLLDYPDPVVIARGAASHGGPAERPQPGGAARLQRPAAGPVPHQSLSRGAAVCRRDSVDEQYNKIKLFILTIIIK